MKKKIISVILGIFLLALLTSIVFAVSTDVAGVVEKTWNQAKDQIRQVVDNVVFPIIDLILAVLLFVKIAMSYMEYKKKGQIDFVQPAIIFISLVFSLTAPLYIWQII